MFLYNLTDNCTKFGALVWHGIHFLLGHWTIYPREDNNLTHPVVPAGSGCAIFLKGSKRGQYKLLQVLSLARWPIFHVNLLLAWSTS